MIFKKGIARKTFLFAFLLILLVCVLSFSIFYFAMPSYYLYSKNKALHTGADELAAQLRDAASKEDCAGLIAGFVTSHNANVMSFDADNALLAEISSPFVTMTRSGNSFYTTYSEEDRGNVKNGARFSIIVREEGEPLALIGGRTDRPPALKLHTRGGQSVSFEIPVENEWIGSLMINSPLQPIDEAKGVILSLIPYVLLLSVAVGFVVAYLFAKQLTRPILKISAATVQMKEMEPDALSDVRSNDELGELSENLDALYGSLCDTIASLREETQKANRLERSKSEFMQNASHELKTPIAALNGIIEGMIDGVGVYVDKDKHLSQCAGLIDKLSELVGEILNASKSDLPEDEITCSEINLQDLIEPALEAHTLFAREKRLVLQKENLDVAVSSDYTLLKQTLSNLVSNAVRYTVQGGTVRISARREDDIIRLEIENECENIPETELQKLFEPFYTLSYSRDKSKSGTGLGLYIAKKNLERLKIPFVMENTETGIKFVMDFQA